MKVVQTIRSLPTGHGNTLKDVDIVCYTGDDKAKAIAALANASCDYEDAAFVSVISVRIDF